MSKQPPKQRTLEFFMQKPKTQGTSKATANKSSETTKVVNEGVKTAKSGDYTVVGRPNKQQASTGNTGPARPIANGPSKISSTAVEESASSPLIAFPSSRSIPSDGRSVSSEQSAGRSRASSPPASEAPDVDMMDEDEEVVAYRPVRLTPLDCDLMVHNVHGHALTGRFLSSRSHASSASSPSPSRTRILPR